MGFWDIVPGIGYLRSYKNAVEKLNDLFGRDGYATHEYVCVGIYLMQNKDRSGFTPKAVLDIAELIEEILSKGQAPRAAATKMIAEAIFKKCANVSRAKEGLECIITEGDGKDRFDFFQLAGEKLKKFKYDQEGGKKSSSIPPG